MAWQDDKLLYWVAEQIAEDHDLGDTALLYDMLDMIPRDVLVSYLTRYRQQLALKDGVIDLSEIEDNE